MASPCSAHEISSKPSRWLLPRYLPTYGIMDLIQVVCHDWRRVQRVHRVGRWVGRLPLQVGSGPVVVDLVASSAVSVVVVVVVGASSLAAIMALSSASSQPYSSASSSESAISS